MYINIYIYMSSMLWKTSNVFECADHLQMLKLIRSLKFEKYIIEIYMFSMSKFLGARNQYLNVD